MSVRIPFIRNKRASIKRIFVKIGLILRKTMQKLMKRDTTIRHADVERANSFRKLRLLLGMDEQTCAKNLGLTVEALQCYENADCPLPDSVIDRACALAGLQPADFTSGKIDKLFNDTKTGAADFIPADIPPSELFDLLNAYSIVRRKGDYKTANILGLLQMLICGHPEIEEKDRSRGTG